jgi:hypothetical protein
MSETNIAKLLNKENKTRMLAIFLNNVMQEGQRFLDPPKKIPVVAH